MDKINPLDLIHIQLELECIGTDTNNFLFRIPGDNPDDIARFYVTRHAAGYTTFFRHDVESRIVERLRSLPPQQAFEDIETVKRILHGEIANDASVSMFRSYYFADAPSPAQFPDVVRQGAKFIIFVEGEPVCWARSSRSNSRASELATETKPDFRHRGYAHQVSSAWALHQLEQGKVAFYSHKWENVASQALAKSLGVVYFVDGVNYE